MEWGNHTYNLRDFLTAIFKHKNMIGTVILATVIMVTVGSFLKPPIYESKTSLLVKPGRENIYRPEIGNSNKIFFSTPKRILKTEIKILRSQDLMENVVKNIGVKNLYPYLANGPKVSSASFQSAVKTFQSNISVENARNSDIIDITFQHSDPKITATTLNLLVKLFKEKHIEVFENALPSLFNKRLKVYEEKLVQSEKFLEAFKEKHKIFSHKEQKSLLLKQGMDLDMSLKETQNRIGELDQKISFLKNQIRLIPEKKTLPLKPGANGYEIIDEGKINLLALRRKESNLLKDSSNTGARNRKLSSVRNEIKVAEGFVAKLEDELKMNMGIENDVLYQEIKMQLILSQADRESLGAKEKNIKRQLKQLDQVTTVLDQKGLEFKRLLRELSTNEKTYEMYLQKLEEANALKEMDELKLDNISVIQEAKVPANPIKPNIRMNVTTSIFLGAFAGICLALISEYLGHGFSRPEAVEKRLGLPVIATVSYRG